MTDTSLVYFNGVRPDGHYGQQPLPEDEVIRRLQSGERDWREHPKPDPRGHEDPTRRPIYGVDASRLEQAGWAIVFPRNGDPRIKRALRKLCDHRREQVGDDFAHRYGEIEYLPGDSGEDFLRRQRAPTGEADPDKLPYHLLLVGAPDEIPFSVQFDLDFVYSVGRLHFDRLEDYERYATSVVDHETRRRPMTEATAAFFGPRNPNDRATRRTSQELLTPLAESLVAKVGSVEGVRWRIEGDSGAYATRERLLELLGGPAAPSVLFTASHGMELGLDEEKQLEHQGAILCSDWPGPENPVEREHYVAAEDVPDDAQLRGMIIFHFGCYTAGTQEEDSFPDEHGSYRRIAPYPFTARLPQRLLAHPNGGALAVIGHVDRAWTTSFGFRRTEEISTFRSAVHCLLDGKPVGEAMEFFSQRHGDLGLRLNGLRERRDSLSPEEQKTFARQRLAARDARNFIVLGDPAVRVG